MTASVSAIPVRRHSASHTAERIDVDFRRGDCSLNAQRARSLPRRVRRHHRPRLAGKGGGGWSVAVFQLAGAAGNVARTARTFAAYMRVPIIL